MSEPAKPLTASEYAALKQRVGYMIASATENREHWIDTDIWLQTFATIDAKDAEIAELCRQLAECFRLTGADVDGNEDWRIAPDAVEEVRRLRKEDDAHEECIVEQASQITEAMRIINGCAANYDVLAELRKVLS